MDNQAIKVLLNKLENEFQTEGSQQNSTFTGIPIKLLTDIVVRKVMDNYFKHYSLKTVGEKWNRARISIGQQKIKGNKWDGFHIIEPKFEQLEAAIMPLKKAFYSSMEEGTSIVGLYNIVADKKMRGEISGKWIMSYEEQDDKSIISTVEFKDVEHFGVANKTYFLMKMKEGTCTLNWAKDMIEMGIDTPWVKARAVNEREAPEAPKVPDAQLEIKHSPFE